MLAAEKSHWTASSMARNFITGIIVKGDAKDGVKAIELTKKEQKELNRTIDRGSSFAKDYKRNMSSAARTLKTAFVGSVIAGSAALAVMVTKGLSAVDTLGKTSGALGVTTQKLAGLNRAFDVTGAGADRVGQALGKTAKFVLDAQLGLATATDALDLLGIKIEDIENLQADEVFEALADKISLIESPLTKAGIASQIFGQKLGTNLVNTLNLGKEGFAQAAEEARVLGTALDGNMVASVERANDSFDRLQMGAEGFSQQLAVKLAPALTTIGDKFFEAVKQAGGMETIAAEAVATLTTVVGFLSDNLILMATVAIGAKVIPGLVSMTAWLANAARAGGAMAATTRGLTAALAPLGGPVGLLLLAATGFAAYAFSAETATERSADLAREIETLSNSLSAMSKQQAQLALAGYKRSASGSAGTVGADCSRTTRAA